MASKTSAPEAEPWPGPRVDFADFAAHLAARRAELGEPELPPQLRRAADAEQADS